MVFAQSQQSQSALSKYNLLRWLVQVLERMRNTAWDFSISEEKLSASLNELGFNPEDVSNDNDKRAIARLLNALQQSLAHSDQAGSSQSESSPKKPGTKKSSTGRRH